MKSYICKMCGAEIIINDDINFTKCLYCGNSIAIINEELKDLNIKKIIPFSIDKEEAIEAYKHVLRKNIVEAKKVYVPVRYCNYNFDYLLYYEYEVEHTDSDGNTSTSYYDAETLIDGNVTNELVFGDSKVNNVYLEYEIRKQERLDYDPVLVKDVSIEYSKFNDSETEKKYLEENVRRTGRKKIYRDISEIYSENYYIYGVNYETFTTLIPIYIIKTSRGEIYNFPGVMPTKSVKMSKSRIIKLYTSIILIIISLLGIFKVNNEIEIYMKNKSIYYIFVALLIVGITLFFRNVSNKKILNYNIQDNYDYTKYEYGDHRKNVK